MLDKYFGFIKLHDEFTVVESLIAHSKVSQDELYILEEMGRQLCEKPEDTVEPGYLKIRRINKETQHHLETVAEQIIQANFDYQKQYDLLRLHQRIESITGLIIATAKRMLICQRIDATIPNPLHKDFLLLIDQTTQIIGIHLKALEQYIESKKHVLEIITQVEELEHTIDHQRAVCLETLYRLGNQGQLPIGSFRIIEDIIDHLEEISDSVESSARSLEWLLLS